MAHLLQAVAILLAAAAPSAAASFSHRIHLSKKLNCLTCHAAAARSGRPADNLLPAPKTCAACHTGAAGQLRRVDDVAIKQPAVTLVTKFSHAKHQRLGAFTGRILTRAIDSKTYLSPPGIRPSPHANACTGCHKGLETADSVSKANFPKMADCLVCHPKVEPPFSCVNCHDDSPALKPANHGAGFVDLHSSGKANLDKTTCAVCHGRRFTCLGCH